MKRLIALIAATILFSTNANAASWKLVASSPGGGVPGQVYTAIAPCVNYEFDTQAHMMSCVSSRLNDFPDVQLSVGGVPGSASNSPQRFKLADGTCGGGNYSSLPSLQAWWPYQAGGGLTVNGSSSSVYVRAVGKFTPTSHGSHPSYIYTDLTCATLRYFNYSVFPANVVYNAAGTGGNNPQIPTEVVACRLPPSWAAVLESPRAVANGYITLYKGDKARIYVGGSASLSPSYYGPDGQPIFEDSFALGIQVVRKFPEYNDSEAKAVCFFRRNRAYLDKVLGTQIWQLELIEPGGSYVSYGENTDPIIVEGTKIRARTDVSDPVIPHGSFPDTTGKVQRTSDWCTAAIASKGQQETTSCRDTTTELIKSLVEAEWANKPTPYTHPSPANLARDNPDCVAKFDPRCAWKESPNPVDENTKKDELIRLTNDGAKIVNNYNYSNTIYPPAMVAAGNAPSGPPGTPSNPDDPAETDDGDGQGAGDAEAEVQNYLECYATPEAENCAEVYSSAEAGADARGAIDAAMGEHMSVSGIGSDLISRAIDAGECSVGETSSYCSVLAAMGTFTDRYVPLQDWVLFDEEITLPSGEVVPWIIKIPGWVSSFLILIFLIIRYWVGFWLLLTGRFQGGDD